MDPLSAGATAIAVATQVSTTLYTFVQDAKCIDESLASFLAETNNLKRSITAVEGSLQGLVLPLSQASNDEQMHELCSSVDDSLQDCGKTCEELNSVLLGIRGNSHSQNPLRQPLKAVRLNMNSDNIVRLRDQINSHNSALQLSLQMINV